MQAPRAVAHWLPVAGRHILELLGQKSQLAGTHQRQCCSPAVTVLCTPCEEAAKSNCWLVVGR